MSQNENSKEIYLLFSFCARYLLTKAVAALEVAGVAWLER